MKVSLTIQIPTDREIELPSPNLQNSVQQQARAEGQPVSRAPLSYAPGDPRVKLAAELTRRVSSRAANYTLMVPAPVERPLQTSSPAGRAPVPPNLVALVQPLLPPDPSSATSSGLAANPLTRNSPPANLSRLPMR